MTTPVVVAASHHGTVSSGYVTWRSHYVLSATDDANTIVLARPLPMSALPVARGAAPSPIRDATGAIVAFSVPRSGVTDVVLEIVEPSDALAIAPPLAAGDATQRISLDGDGEPMFEVDPRLGVARHVGYAASPGLEHDERERCDAVLARHGEPTRGDAVYLRATGQLAEHALTGHLTTRGERSRPAAVAAFVAFVLIAIALVVLARRLRREAQVERAEAEIEDAFRDMAANEGEARRAPS